MSKPTFIDLFAGAGGLSEGFIRAGFEPLAHVEMDKAACYTLKTRLCYHYLKGNRKFDTYISYLKGEIDRDKLYEKVPTEILDTVINLPISKESNPTIHRRIGKLLNKRKVDLIIGGPPCQAYSLAGRARDINNMVGDHRNYLYVHYAKYLERYRPKMFLFENVIGLKSAKNGSYLKNMRALFLKKGYEMKLFTVVAHKYGVLQNRRRVIILGWEKGKELNVPDLEVVSSVIKGKVSDLLSDLPQIAAGGGVDRSSSYATSTNNYLSESKIRNGLEVLTQHVARPHTEQDKKIYRIAIKKWTNEQERLNYNDLPEELKTHSNRDSFLDRFKVVGENEEHTQTVVAHIAKDGHYYIHPDIHQTRSLSVREAARLQSFSDDYYFEGVKKGTTRTPAFKQIGNAVPPLMAFIIAKSIKDSVYGI